MHGSVLVYKKDNKQNIFLHLRETEVRYSYRVCLVFWKLVIREVLTTKHCWIGIESFKCDC